MTEETVRPEDLKPGDRVRVTFEGVIDEDGDFPLSNEEYIFKYQLAHATITRLPPPVDPDLLLARKVVAAVMLSSGYRSSAAEIERGNADADPELLSALAALKALKEQSK